MAHEISITSNGIAEAAFAIKGAWHGLGTVLPYAPNSDEMIKAAHLDWEVGMIPMVGKVIGGKDDGLEIKSSSFQVVRQDTMSELGVVKEGYGLVQNREAFDFLDSLMQDGVMKYESAGALYGGRVVWVLGRMPSVDQIGENDNVVRYVLFSTSHDGSRRLRAHPTATRVVCANTLALACQTIPGIRHIGDMKTKLDFQRKYISQFDEMFTLFRDNGRRMAGIKTSPEMVKKYINTLFPEVEKPGRGRTIRENKVAAIRGNLVNSRQSMDSARGTVWGMFNAVTEFIDHSELVQFKGEGRQAQENKMDSNLFGDNADFKGEAYTLALNLAGIS